MKLQILVPHYKERPDEVEPLLDSIAIQQSVDFDEVGVIIAYDGDEATALPEEEWARKYPYEIKHIHRPHGGVSATRNAALDEATADYVMFCDADDLFCHVCGLYLIFREMPKHFDTMTSAFVEETRDPETKEPVYVNHNQDSTFVHGKVHRRGYLMDKGIRFNPKLTIHEDSYFNILAQNLTDQDKALFCPTPFYLWKWRDCSVCRHDKDYILKTYTNMLDSNDALVDEFERRGYPEKARMFAGFMIFDSYYTLNKKEWLEQTNHAYRETVEKRFAEYFAKHKAKWDAIDPREKMTMSNGVRTRSVNEGMPMETITIGQWLELMETIKE